MEDGHSKTVDEVLSHFRVDPDRGLTIDQVKEYQKKYGPNGKWHKKTVKAFQRGEHAKPSALLLPRETVDRSST